LTAYRRGAGAHRAENTRPAIKSGAIRADEDYWNRPSLSFLRGPIDPSSHPAALLYADRPLTEPSHDALGHATFARHLSACIAQLSPREGIVFGVYGDPGSGRSTVLNFVRGMLRDDPSYAGLTVVDWNPWLLAGDEGLERRLVHLLAAASLEDAGDTPPDPSNVAALQARVASALAGGDRKVVVTIDDVCRLDEARGRELLRLLSAYQGTPNLVFVLALEHDSPVADLLPRVVQVPIDLPLPDRALLQQMFVDRLAPVLDRQRESSLLDEEYWEQVCVNGIDHFLATPRDALKLVNTVTATLPAVSGEVNPVDFIGLETLRLFAPVAYEAIRQRRDAFLLPPHARRAETGALALTTEYHDRWREKVAPDDKVAVEFLVMRLFPRIADVLALRQIGADPEESWRGNLRVCAEELYPVYFQLAIPLGAISNADLQSRLEHLDDPNQFAAILLELARDSRPDAGARLRAFLERLESHVGENATGEEVASALRALFQAADDLLRREDQRGVEGQIDIQTQLRRIIRRFVSQIEPGERVELLESTIAAEGSLACAVDTVVMLGQEHGKYGGEWREGAATVVSLSQLAQLENIALTFVRDAAAEEKLLRTPRMPEVLQCWATWNRGECRTWVARTIESDNGLLAFLDPFMREVGSPSASARGMRVSNRLDQRRLRPFLEPGSIVNRVKELAKRDGVDEQQRALMERYVLDHELLQQATSADYVEGDADTGESYAA
jgi:predicted KAP-like P-loop ATPase